MIKVFKTAQLFFDGQEIPPFHFSPEPVPMASLTLSLTMISTSTLEKLEADLELARYQRDLAREQAAKQTWRREIAELVLKSFHRIADTAGVPRKRGVARMQVAADMLKKQAEEIGHLQDTVNTYAARINRAEAEPPAMIAHLHKLEKDARFTGRGLYSKGIRAAIDALERGAHRT